MIHPYGHLNYTTDIDCWVKSIPNSTYINPFICKPLSDQAAVGDVILIHGSVSYPRS